jgi:hypothetical protein
MVDPATEFGVCVVETERTGVGGPSDRGCAGLSIRGLR